MLKYRLIFGTLMVLFFTGVIIFDGCVDGSLTSSQAINKNVQGTIFYIIIALLVVPAQLEFSALAAGKNLKIFKPVSIIATMLLAGCWYWPQVVAISGGVYLAVLLAFTLFAMFFYQHLRYGNENVIGNCGVNCFSVLYLGLLSGFVLAIRVDFGVWALLMFIATIKTSDIGAYTFGRIFGKHKFSPRISPGKTWEGMAGAVASAMIVAVLFAVCCDAIDVSWYAAVALGVVMAFVGQLGDLAESMLKRDAEKKDSAQSVPGFGGVLDVIDSPLVAAPVAYLFFKWVAMSS
ncbi:phosphatidate cytidylyltransferase [Planctomycetota bacterium]